MPRKYPNIIITGTPGTGKTTTSTTLVDQAKSSSPPLPLKLLSINDIAKKHNYYDSWDAELQTHVVDEDKVVDHVEEVIEDGEGEGGWVIDWHICEVFPERWVDLVVVLRCDDTGVFYERLAGKPARQVETQQDGESKVEKEGRGYTGEKLQENIDAEIFGVIADEARGAWPGEGRVVELSSVEAHEIEENCDRILDWCKQWMKDQQEEG